ncbi:MAG TPA: hypothetical protein VFN88_12825 [Caulobacteraceae bacterium]|nr:hypothetical protein [Caulobacteraceae bacterium]
MTDDTHPMPPMRKGRLLAITAIAAVAGFLIVFGAIVPAEFGRDPLGLGKLDGLSRLYGKSDRNVDPNAGGVKRAQYYQVPWRSDVVEIPLTSFLGGNAGSELEYKVRMKKDATLIYEWTVTGAEKKDDFHFDFHGHTTPPPGQEMTVATYRQAYGLHGNGSLTAPFDGIQGWQFSNSSDKPIVVKLRLAGFYELIPSGQAGNESNIVANVPAAQARPDRPDALTK